MQGPFPRLKFLELQDTDVFHHPILTLPSWAHTPNLTSLNIFLRAIPYPDLSIPWHQLTSLMLFFPASVACHGRLPASRYPITLWRCSDSNAPASARFSP